jgi:hypothetical protein
MPIDFKVILSHNLEKYFKRVWTQQLNCPRLSPDVVNTRMIYVIVTCWMNIGSELGNVHNRML